jgi:hypothetical protein
MFSANRVGGKGGGVFACNAGERCMNDWIMVKQID